MRKLLSFMCAALVLPALPSLAQFEPPKKVAGPGDITQADVQGYSRHIRYWLEKGVPSPGASGFKLTYPDRVGENAAIQQDALVLFTDLYADRLVLDMDDPGYYTIEDLILDDPEVFDRFMEYTTTGVLALRAERDGKDVTNQHMEMIALAIATDDDCLEVTDYWVIAVSNTDYEVGSMLLTEKKKCKPPTPGPGPQPEPENIPDILKNPVRDFPLRQHPYYEDDGSWPWSQPGFDCDDWADALAEYLRRILEGQVEDLEIWQFWVTWKGDGHVVTVVRINGKYYIVDGQTGMMRGPYDSLEDAKDGAWDIMKDGYDVDKDDVWFPRITKRKPGERPFVEPSPWYTDPDRRRDFEEDTGLDPDDYTPPGN